MLDQEPMILLAPLLLSCPQHILRPTSSTTETPTTTSTACTLYHHHTTIVAAKLATPSLSSHPSSVNTTSPTATPLWRILFQNHTSTSSGVAPSGPPIQQSPHIREPNPEHDEEIRASESLPLAASSGFDILFAAAGYLL